MDDRSTFGRWVKWRRNTLGLTQAHLAQLVACSKDLIKKIEADTRRPSVQIVRRLADALTIGADDYRSFFDLARPDLSAQPRYIADMGCGDGTLLKRVHETVLRHTRRSRARAAFTAGCDLYKMVTLSSGSSHNASAGDTSNVE